MRCSQLTFPILPLSPIPSFAIGSLNCHQNCLNRNKVCNLFFISNFFLHFLKFFIIFLYEDSKGLKGMTDLGLMFPAPAVVKQDRLSPRVSESSDASTSDSSQSGFQVIHNQMCCVSALTLTVFFSGF